MRGEPTPGPDVAASPPEEPRLLGAAFASLLVKGCAAAAGFVANVLIARALGAAGAGTYFLAITCVTAFAVVGRSGTDVAALRAISGHLRRGWNCGADAVESWAWGRLFRWALLAWATLAAFAWFLAPSVFGEPDLGLPLLVASSAVVPIGVLSLLAEVLKARGRVTWGMAVQSLLVPLGMVAGMALLLLWSGGGDPALAAGAYLVTTSSTAIVGWMLLRRTRTALASAPNETLSAAALTDLRSSSTAFMVIAMQNLVVSLTDTVMLGILADATAVGLYGVALRVTSLGNLVLAAINGVVGPRFAGLAATGDHDALKRLARTATRAMAGSSLVMFAALITFREPILMLFGPEFVAAQGAFVVLSLGQLVVLGTGPVAYLLMMSGHRRFHRNGLTLAALANVVLNVVLIPPFGILGAAIATAASLGVKNLATLAYVRLRLGFWVLP